MYMLSIKWYYLILALPSHLLTFILKYIYNEISMEWKYHGYKTKNTGDCLDFVCGIFPVRRLTAHMFPACAMILKQFNSRC
jgi:hypothetical protein